MVRKRKATFINLASSDCSDGSDDDELSLPLDSSDPDENDDSNYDDLVDLNVSFFLLSIDFVYLFLFIDVSFCMIHFLLVINLLMKLSTRSA
jgi:hypothetical protein